MRRKAIKMRATKKALTKKPAAKAKAKPARAKTKKGGAGDIAGSFLLVSDDETLILTREGLPVALGTCNFSQTLFPSKDAAKDVLMTANLDGKQFGVFPAKKYVKYGYGVTPDLAIVKSIVSVHDTGSFTSAKSAIKYIKAKFKALIVAAKADIKNANNTLKQINADYAKAMKAAAKHA